MRKKKSAEPDLQERFWNAEFMENSPAKVALLEEVIRMADLSGDVEIGFDARSSLIDAATFSGAADKALVAFSWCLSQADKSPDLFDEFDLLWKFKWVTDSLSSFPQVTKKQIEDTLTDMSVRYERAGVGQRPIVQLRWTLAIEMGDKAAARKYYPQWRKMPKDVMSDCPACVQDREIDRARFLDDDAAALAAAEPIIQGRLKCAEIPHKTFAHLLLPLVRMGRLDQASELHTRGYRLVTRNLKLLRAAAAHLQFFALTDNLAKGAKAIEKHFPEALTTPQMEGRFYFFLAAQFLIERFINQGTESLKLRLPKTWTHHQDKSQYDTTELQTRFAEETASIAKLFDARNGNKYFAQTRAGVKKLHALATPFPLE